MKIKLIKNLISSFMILSFILTPVFGYVEVAQAQSYSTPGSYSISGGNIQGAITGIGPIITKLPLCKDKINKAVKGLFRGIKNLFSKKRSDISVTPLAQKAINGGLELKSIQTNDKQTLEAVQNVEKKADNTQKAVESLDSSQSCLKSIGQILIGRLIQKIAVSTVDWINHGFEGKPLFVQNLGKFSLDYVKEDILGFNAKINDPQKYPFGRAFIKTTVNAFNSRFENNATYSLDKLIKQRNANYSAAGFKKDFSQGGWEAWLNMTTIPANNPIGFEILAANELQKQIDTTTSNFNAQLNRSGGFLAVEKCADPVNVTRESHRNALILGKKDANGNIEGVCKRWDIVTPGSFVGKLGSDALGLQKDSLLKADDLNTAIAAVVDSLLNRWTSDFINKGFASTSREGIDGSYIIDQASNTISPDSQVDQDFSENYRNNHWLEKNPDFNIRTDLTQAIIDEQRTYALKLTDQNKNLDELIKSIRQLDYCIPGPNPDWEDTSSVENFYSTIKVSRPGELSTAVQILLSFDPTGIISGIANAIFDADREKEIKKGIAHYLEDLFDVGIYDGQDQVLDEGGIRDLIENTFETYRQVISKTYFAGSKSLSPMPQVTSDARLEFSKIEAYEHLIVKNEEDIAFKKSLVTKLADMKDSLDKLDKNDPNYESNLVPWITLFGRLAADMVTGDDVADADNLNKEIINDQQYVFNDLLKGPGGCEKEMDDLYASDPKTYAKFVGRQPYPLPIYYLYGRAKHSNDLPPYQNGGGGPSNKTPWKPELVGTWDVNDGFLWGSVYWNGWARPYDPVAGIKDVRNAPPPDLKKVAIACPDEFIDVVEISLPGGEAGDPPADVGGLDPIGTPPGWRDNSCGVVTRRFEKIFNIY